MRFLFVKPLMLVFGAAGAVRCTHDESGRSEWVPSLLGQPSGEQATISGSKIRKPYKFIGFGAMDVTKPYKFIGFGAMDVTKPYQ